MAARTCAWCGYSLQGLRPDGHCPECGRAVAASVRAERLHHADLGWLRSVAKGLHLLRFAAWLIWVVPISPLLVSVASVVGDDKFAARAAVLCGASVLFAATCSFAGLFMVSSREPDEPKARPGRRLRIATRVLASLSLVAVVLSPFSFQFVRANAVSSLWSALAILLTVALVGSAATVAGFWLEALRRRSRQLRRVPHGSLLTVVFFAVALVLLASGPVLSRGARGTPEFFVISLLALLLTGLAALVAWHAMLKRCRLAVAGAIAVQRTQRPETVAPPAAALPSQATEADPAVPN